MTQEEKLLLLEDLGSRLMYGVIVDYKDDEYGHYKWKITTLFAPAYSQDGTLIDTDHEGWIGYDEYKGCGMSSGSRLLYLEKTLPFLRPLSSMTEKEKDEFLLFFPFCRGDMYFDVKNACVEVFECPNKITLYPFGDNVRLIDWLNKKMFDYRGLIPMGLALEAPEGMYSTQ